MDCINCKSENVELITGMNEITGEYYEYYFCNDCGNSWEED